MMVVKGISEHVSTIQMSHQLTSILDVPPEILLEIFKFLDYRTLFKIVIRTCKHFYNILTGDDIWKTLFTLKWKEHAIVEDLPYISNWNDVCFTFEDVDNFWKERSRKNVKLRHFKMAGHFAPVDAVHILSSGRFCVSGSRDRSAILWDLTNFVQDNEDGRIPSIESLQGHKGWIWAVDSDKNKGHVVVTSSWDQTVKEWDLNSVGEAVNTHSYHPAAILDLCCHDNLYTTGCYDKIVRTFDPRSQSVVFQSKHHREPVLCLQMTEHFILSGSADQTIGIFDIRGGKLMSSMRIDSPVLCLNLASSQGFNYLRAGGKEGSLFIFDMSHDSFTLLNSTELWHNHKLTQLCTYRGAVAACSQSGAVCMYSPGRNVKLLEKFELHSGDVADADSCKDLLVTGSSDNTAIAWKFD